MSGQGRWLLLNAEPWVLAVLAVVCLLALIAGHRSSRGRPPRVRLLLFGVRAASLLLLAVAVLRPAHETELTRAKRPPLAVVVDDSKSMALSDPAPAAGALRWLEANRGRMGELGEWFRVERLAVDAPPRPLAADAPADVSAFSRNATPLARSLEELARLRPDLAGVVLVSDGRDTERPGALPGLKVPVYPVLVGPATVADDLWIEKVDAPPVAFIRTPVELRIKIGVAGRAAGPVEVRLVEEGLPLKTETVTVGREGGEASLVFTPRRTGRKAYRVEVTPRPGERNLENNRAQFSLNVIRDKTRVLLVAGTPTWDSKFLGQRLRQDPGIDLITFLILRTPADLNLVDSAEMSLIPFPTQELFNQELPSFDVVFLVNFDYSSYVPAQYLENLRKFVREAGGGLAVLGGDRSLGLGGYADTALAEVLPVDLSGALPGQAFRPGRFRVRPTEAGKDHPILRLSPDAERNRRLWETLPPLDGLNWSLRVRSGAVALAETPEAKNEYGPATVLALGEYGAGRTLAVMTDSLWRWKMPLAAAGGDEALYSEFWTRALRWLTHEPDMELVRLSPPAEGATAGSPLRFTARVLDRGYRPATGATLRGGALDESGASTPLTFREIAPGEYLSDPVTPAKAGLWKAWAEGTLAGATLGRDELAFPVGLSSPEPLRVGVDRDFLQKLAASTGGKAFEADDEALWDLLLAKGRLEIEVVGRSTEEPWATPWFLVLALALLGADWALRRFHE